LEKKEGATDAEQQHRHRESFDEQNRPIDNEVARVGTIISLF
jgi:hypothetical protein